MKKIYDAVLRALEEMDIHFDYDQENEVFNYRLSTELTTYRQRLVPLEEQELLLTITNFPIMVPEDKRFLMTSLLNKLNHSLILGHYVMDPEDGEISFRVSCPVDDGAINKTIVLVAIGNSITTMDNHLPELLSAIGNLPTSAPALSNNKPMAYA